MFNKMTNKTVDKAMEYTAGYLRGSITGIIQDMKSDVPAETIANLNERLYTLEQYGDMTNMKHFETFLRDISFELRLLPTSEERTAYSEKVEEGLKVLHDEYQVPYKAVFNYMNGSLSRRKLTESIMAHHKNYRMNTTVWNLYGALINQNEDEIKTFEQI